MMCVYLRTNKVNGKQYVGQTVNFKQRDRDWKYNKNYSNGAVDNARAKYGVENFKTDILRECDTQEELNYWEQYYIKTLNTKVPNGYNITDGGGGMSGYHMSEQSKTKISNANKGRVFTEEHRQKLALAKIGKHLTEEHKRKIGEKGKGKVMTKQQRMKISEARKGIQFSDETRKKMSDSARRKPPMTETTRKKISMSEINNEKKSKKVYQYTLEGELVKIWKSTMDCDRNGYCSSKVSCCCNGVRKSHKGYRWSYRPL